MDTRGRDGLGEGHRRQDGGELACLTTGVSRIWCLPRRAWEAAPEGTLPRIAGPKTIHTRQTRMVDSSRITGALTRGWR